MTHSNLSRIDLKLLVALQVLIEERNVTRAAERLHVTQPALSKTLQKLKQLFHDPLFTRSAHGLIPTPKTEELAQKLPGLLEQFQQLITEPEFDPAAYHGRFRLALPQMITQVLVPELVGLLCQQAPHVELEVMDLPANYLEQLASGQLDFIIQRQQDFDSDYDSYPLGIASGKCLMRAGHPLSSKPRISLQDYLDYPHVRVYFPGMSDNNVGIIDEVLKHQGLKRDVLLATTDLGCALETLLRSDCLMVGAGDYTHMNRFTRLLHATEFPAPLEFPKLQFSLLQHRRSRNSQAHLWLRELLQQLSLSSAKT